MKKEKGIIIVLNGASSTGKTSIAQALQNLLGEQCVCVSLDSILERLRPFGPENVETFIGKLQRNLRIIWFQITDGRLRLFRILHREVIELSKAKQYVIVETALMDKRALQDAAQCFAPQKGFFIGVKPPLEISEQWEKQRSDRPIGQARKHYELIHAHGVYDLVVDPSQTTPEECAEVILRRIKGPLPNAFQRLVSQGTHE